MQSNKMMFGILALFLVGLLGSYSVFTVQEWQKAILFRLGEIVRTDFKPGLHFKMPFINNVRLFDGRILTLDARPERFLTKEKKNVLVDSFVKWRIQDVGRFYTSTGGDEARANSRLSQIIKDSLKSEFGQRTIKEVVSGERRDVMDILTAHANDEAQKFGIDVVDMRIKRIDLPAEVSSSVYRRMEAERARVAKELRSQGAEAAERIRADADRQRTIILAEAYREAEKARGQGDAKATGIYADAFKQDPEFYALYRSLRAYRDSFSNKSDILVLEPDSEFFKYFKAPQKAP